MKEYDIDDYESIGRYLHKNPSKIHNFISQKKDKEYKKQLLVEAKQRNAKALLVNRELYYKILGKEFKISPLTVRFIIERYESLKGTSLFSSIDSERKQVLLDLKRRKIVRKEVAKIKSE